MVMVVNIFERCSMVHGSKVMVPARARVHTPFYCDPPTNNLMTSS